jgi:hypothetical protein
MPDNTRDLDRLEALHRRVAPITGLVCNYLVAATLVSIVGAVVAVSMGASGGRGEGGICW